MEIWKKYHADAEYKINVYNMRHKKIIGILTETKELFYLCRFLICKIYSRFPFNS